MKPKPPDLMAAWAVAVLLVVLMAVVPWHKLGANVPVGVVDPTQQRYVPETSFGESTDDLYHHDSHFSKYSPEGL
jgi:hypothetical protein